MILNITAFPVFRAKEYMGPIESSSSSMWGCDIRSQGGVVWWWFKGIWCPKNMIWVLHFWWKWSWDLAANAACFDESFRHRIETSEIFWVCWALEPQITWCSWQSFRPCGKVYHGIPLQRKLRCSWSWFQVWVTAPYLWRCWALGSPFGHFITVISVQQ